MAKAMLIDTDLCLDCNACTVECKRNNQVPVGQGIAWTRMEEYEVGTFPAVKTYFIKRACNHCTEASCLNVCPTGAISRPDGVHVVINQEWCIGCGYCTQACPFGIPHFGDPKGSAQKCRFCYGTKADDEPTACAAACPFGAITFGERDQLIQAGRARVEQLRQKGKANATLYGEKELGGLNVLYVLADRPAAYGLPENPKVSTARVGANWLSGIATAGILAFIPFYALFKRKEALAVETGGKEAKESEE
ncbi:MAG TPA: 4Fe-4S dicluster domain-containing protein [Anaerolineae bacterium]|nr:4Fe-4S dicluster domain-containing protein [Anaerolineae bacterium]